MNKQQWTAEVGKLYVEFKSIVLENPSAAAPAIFDLVKSGHLKSAVISDQTILKGAVLWSHCDWEGLYQEQAENMSDVLGHLAHALQQFTEEHSGLSSHEMELLRREVVYGDSEYSETVRMLKEAEAQFASVPPPDGHMGFIGPLRKLGKWKDLLHHLRAANVQGPDDPLRQLFSPLYTMLVPGEYVSDADLEQAICDFRSARELNLLSGFTDPVVFDTKFAEALREAVKRRSAAATPVDSGSARSPIIDRLLALQAATKVCIVESDSESTLRALDDQTVSMMREHDDLLLNNAQLYVTGVAQDDFFFAGSRILSFLKQVNLTFPEKAGFLDGAAEAHCFKWPRSHFKQLSSSIANRLSWEFPGYIEDMNRLGKDLGAEDGRN